MKDGVINSPKLIYEEEKAIKLFLWMFNIIFFIFDFYYYYILPTHKKPFAIQRDGLGIWIYLPIILLLFTALYFLRKDNPYIVKYIYVISYLCIDLADNLARYIGTTKPFASGNIVEVLFVLFSPIFVNKRFFWVVSLGLIGKDIFLGLILQDTFAFFPAAIYVVLALIAYILLARFNSYINSLTNVHEELRQKEKLAVIGQMATAIGHEIRNPLSSLKGFTQLQQERYQNKNEFYPIMIQEIDRINSIVNDLMYIGKPRAIQFEKASIKEIIAYTFSITQQQAKSQGITIEMNIAGPVPPLECDSKQMKQVFLNLIMNAIESMPEGGWIKVNASVQEESKLSITIEDTGYGIADADIPSLGQPFFTTKQDGTGLGLMVTSQIIKDHNGNLRFESTLGKGTMVSITLPILQKNE